MKVLDRLKEGFVYLIDVDEARGLCDYEFVVRFVQNLEGTATDEEIMSMIYVSENNEEFYPLKDVTWEKI